MVPPDDGANQQPLTTAIEVASRSLVQALLRASEAPPEHVTGSQLAALRAIERRETLNLTQLAEELGTIPSWASRLCDRLEADGYIERRSAEEGRRQVAIRLRPPGQALLDDITLRRRQALDRITAAMPESDRRALLRGLQAFERAARQQRTARSESA